MEGFEGEEGPAEVTVRDTSEEGGDVGGEVEVFLLRDAGEDSAHLRYEEDQFLRSDQEGGRRTSSSDGAPTRRSRQRLRIGPMIRLVELAHRITRKLAVNFSIVRRSADWASRDRRSASLMMTTGLIRE